MDFALFTLIGLAAGLAHAWLPGDHRVRPASALVLGVAGAWGGATFAGAFVRGMLASLWSGLATAGAIVGAVGAIAFMEAVVERYLRDHPDESTRARW